MTTRMQLLRKTAARERGSALVIAIVLMTFMLGSTLALVTYVDSESGQTRVNRTRETAFNFAEAALNSEVYQLARKWPGKGQPTFQGTCSSSQPGTYCPLDSQLRGLFPTTDTASGATWKIDVRDNDPDNPDFYSDATVLDNAQYDKDDDGQLWVRAEAVARGKRRVMVAQVRAEEQPEEIVHAALLSGSLELQNVGKKITIDNSLGGVLRVRCTWNGPVQPCVGYDNGQPEDKLSQQISPYPGADNMDGYTGPPVLSAEAIARLKATAESYGTSYTACPSTLTGKVVYLDVPSGCKFTGNQVFNNASQPGMLIVNRGLLDFAGTIHFYGVIVHLNADALSSTVIELGGTACVEGGVLVEGNGQTHAGASGHACDPDGNIKFNPYMYGAVKSLANAGIIQNTWRELTPGT
jgi:hypothetical protein